MAKTKEEVTEKKVEEEEEDVDVEQEEEKETHVASAMINNANEAAERMEKANKEAKEIIHRQEMLKVEKTLGGTSDAGSQELTEEQKEVAAARKMIEGTGFETDLFPTEAEKEAKEKNGSSQKSV